MASIGATIRKARETKKLTREQLAKKLKITEGYLGHIERDAPVRLSERVVKGISKSLSLKLPTIGVNRHNDKSTRWYRNYRKQKQSA